MYETAYESVSHFPSVKGMLMMPSSSFCEIHPRPTTRRPGSPRVNSHRVLPDRRPTRPQWHIHGRREGALAAGERRAERGKKAKLDLIFSKLRPKPRLRTGTNTELEESSIVKLPGNPSSKENFSEMYESVAIANLLCQLTAFSSGNWPAIKQVFSKST